ncbi:hypothetical protein BpHYR1_025300 [Brachionus plicatilis]|uniref:Uncharacterized protein n=1 Tax=Brachionus plicatilis TaxID=10195 RepID=A0A3M7QHF0_BRAPC|nr:hypothetical protein BpHYR1_025300 [Brachionus plicatilis]
MVLSAKTLQYIAFGSHVLCEQLFTEQNIYYSLSEQKNIYVTITKIRWTIKILIKFVTNEYGTCALLALFTY